MDRKEETPTLKSPNKNKRRKTHKQKSKSKIPQIPHILLHHHHTISIPKTQEASTYHHHHLYNRFCINHRFIAKRKTLRRTSEQNRNKWGKERITPPAESLRSTVLWGTIMYAPKSENVIKLRTTENSSNNNNLPSTTKLQPNDSNCWSWGEKEEARRSVVWGYRSAVGWLVWFRLVGTKTLSKESRRS